MRLNLDALLPRSLVNDSPDERRRARLVVYAFGIAFAVDVLVALLMPVVLWPARPLLWMLAHVAMHAPTLILLRVTRSVAIAANYFVTVVFLQSVLEFEASHALSAFGLIALPVAGTHLVGMRTGLAWTALAAGAALALPGLTGSDARSLHLGIAIATITLAIGTASAIVEASRASAVSGKEVAEDRARLQLDRLRAFIEAAFPCIAEVHEGRLVFVSEGVVDLIGYTSTEAREIGASLPRAQDLAMLASRVFSDPPVRTRAEIRVLHRDGSPRWLEVHAIPIGETPRDARWLFAARNIDDEVRHRERIEQAQRLDGIGSLAAGIAHDFNNLLTVITGYGERMPPSPARDQVLGAARDAAELTGQLLAFGQSGPLVDALIDPESEIATLAPMIRSLLGEDTQLSIHGSAAGATTRIEAGRLRQIVLNLVTNAKEAMPRGGRLDIEFGRVEISSSDAMDLGVSPGAFVRISLSDTGVGMSDEVRQRAFDPFFSTKGPGHGSGLGLASAYGIARRCHGTIELESAPGLGTIARLYLPAAQERVAPAATARAGASTRLRPFPVWIVEDDPRILELMRSALEDAGIETRTAPDAERALALLDEFPQPRVLVTDVVMPGMRGTDLAARMRKRCPGLRVVYISGYAEGEIGDLRSGDAEVRFLAKPFRANDLVEAVSALAAS